MNMRDIYHEFFEKKKKKKKLFLCVSVSVLNQTLKELKSIAKSRIDGSYKSMSKNNLIENLLIRLTKVVK